MTINPANMISKRVCFTGPAMVQGLHIERAHLIALCKEKGVIVQNKVDKDTDFLIVNHDGATMFNEIKSKKYKAWADMEKKVIRVNPEDFLKMVGFL